MKWRYNYCSKTPQKNGTKKQKKLICRVPPLALGKELKKIKNSLPSAKRRGAWQRLMAGGRRHAGHLCRRPEFAERPALGNFFCRRPIFAERPALGKGRCLPMANLCRVPGTRQRQICQQHFFAECLWVWLSAKTAFAECPMECTRQTILHSAK